MEKYKNMVIVSFILALLIFVGISFFSNDNVFKNINLDKFIALIDNTEKTYIYVFNSSENNIESMNDYNNLLETTLMTNNINAYRLDISRLNTDELNTLMKKIDIQSGNLIIPMFIKIEEQKISDILSGTNTVENINDFIKLDEE